jgi:cytochrome c peroxidase
MFPVAAAHSTRAISAQKNAAANHVKGSSTLGDRLSFMGQMHPSQLLRKVGALVGAKTLPVMLSVALPVLCAAALVMAAPGSIYGASEIGLQSLRAQYRRPAAIPFPKENPYSRAKHDLGLTLFFDPILSGAQTRSCATCHNPGLSWGDGKPRAVGEKELPLRSPTLLNVAWTPKLGWDGHFRDLETVALGPINSPDNMNSSEQLVVDRLSAIPGYVRAFNAAFGKGGVTMPKVEQALATFERSIVASDAPFDRWIRGEEHAVSPAAKRGFVLFNGKANCAACHSGWAFTDASFHDIGVARDKDIGRGRLFPSSVKLQYAFKTPTLRDVSRRDPYMHDGTLVTLSEVIDLYNRGGIDRPSRDDEIHQLNLPQSDKADLVAFLQTLDGVQKPFAVPPLPR